MALVVKSGAQETLKYVISGERAEKKPFSVTLQVIKTRVFAGIEDIITKVNQDQSITINTGTYNYRVAKVGILDWDNMVDDKGKQIAMEVNADLSVKDESLDLIPTAILGEIADVISTISRNPALIDTFIETAKDK